MTASATSPADRRCKALQLDHVRRGPGMSAPGTLTRPTRKHRPTRTGRAAGRRKPKHPAVAGTQIPPCALYPGERPHGPQMLSPRWAAPGDHNTPVAASPQWVTLRGATDRRCRFHPQLHPSDPIERHGLNDVRSGQLFKEDARRLCHENTVEMQADTSPSANGTQGNDAQTRPALTEHSG